MNKIKEFFKNPKVAFGILGASVLVLIIVIYVTMNLFPNKEKKLNEYLEIMGSEFYTELFYKQIADEHTGDDLIDLIKKFEQDGIKVNLQSLGSLTSDENKEKMKEFNNNGEDCDKETAALTIYPKSPFGKNDFTIKTHLSCGFDEK